MSQLVAIVEIEGGLGMQNQLLFYDVSWQNVYIVAGAPMTLETIIGLILILMMLKELNKQPYYF